MTLVALFGKLQEYDMEFGRMEKHEGFEHKVRSPYIKD